MPQGYASISFPDNKPRNFYEAALLDNWSEEDFLRRTMLCQLSLDSLFKAHDSPYIFGSFVDVNNSETPAVIEKYKNHFDFIDSNINLIYKLIQHCERLPCGHEGQESMHITSDYLYDQLIMKYGSFTPVTGSYTTLKDFNKKDLTGTLYTSAWE